MARITKDSCVECPQHQDLRGVRGNGCKGHRGAEKLLEGIHSKTEGVRNEKTHCHGKPFEREEQVPPCHQASEHMLSLRHTAS